MSTIPCVVRRQPELITQFVRNPVEDAVIHGAPPVRVVVGHDALIIADDGPGVGTVGNASPDRPGGSTGSGTDTGLALVAWVAAAYGAELGLGTAASGGL